MNNPDSADADSRTSTHLPISKRGLILGALFLVLLALCWTGGLERVAQAEANAALQRVLVAFGVARTLNGVISVAQGTEIALQPAGVGVTLTAGEVLDPLNDLVERFSVLATVAAISLGGQKLLAELLSTFWVNAALSAAIALYLCTVILPPLRRFESVVAKAVSLLVFTRLVFVVVMFSANWLGNLALAERQDGAVAELTQTREEIKTINHKPAPPPADDSILDRVSGFFSDQVEALDISARLDAVLERAEQTVTHLVSLCVLFLLQYVALPIGAFWLAFAGVRTAWEIWWRDSAAR